MISTSGALGGFMKGVKAKMVGTGTLLRGGKTKKKKSKAKSKTQKKNGY